MSLYDLLQSRDASGERINGVAVGIVTNIEDPEQMGRVKVKFPWRENGDESYWARISTLMAGKQRGTFFLPDVGDEVLVAFEMGDIHHPYVIGALWNGEDAPPGTHEEGKNSIKKMTSRNGHEFILDDGDRGGGLSLLTKAGHRISLDDASGGEKIEIVDKTGSNKIVFDSAANAIQVESAMKLSIKSQTIEIEAGSMMKIKAGATLTIQGALVQIN
jgi:uncharacterized protein involved in type VI secretion and phage assembly